MRGSLLFAALAAAAAVGAGCSSRPPPALAPLVEVPSEASVVPLLVGTTRRPSDNPALLFGGERTLGLNHAKVAVSIPPSRQTGEIVWPQNSPPDPRSAFAAADARRIDRTAFQAALRERIRQTGRRHVLVFIHGYNTRFDEAAFRFAQIVKDSGAPVTPVLFSWPSWGSLASYPYDQISASMGRDGLEKLLDDIAREPMVGEISILAHSMGNLVGVEALRNMGLRRGAPHAKIRQFMMAAPDLDVDSAMQNAIAMGERRPRFTLFVSRDDRALNFSRLVWGSRDRLGSIDPTREPYASNLKRFGVDVIDLTDIPPDDALAHGKFAQSPEVVRLLGARLAAGQGLTGGATEVGDIAAGATRGTLDLIGTVLTAPVTIFQEQGPGSAPPASAAIEAPPPAPAAQRR